MHRYWVLGGQYADTSFRAFTDRSPTIAGPFDTEEEATRAWRELAKSTSSLARTRFSILSEKFRS